MMFAAAKGMDYRHFLDALHAGLRFDWYLEVGSQTGRSLAKSRSPSIAVDPRFRLKYDVAAGKTHLHLFQMTSDDFFAAGHLKALKAKPSFSFLDGMHLFEFLLRDFMHTEAAGTPQSVIALHDCVPFGHEMTTRDLDNLPRGPWTGDVWKLIPILQEYRPDLKIEVLDCFPTGLVVVSNLSPRNRTLSRNYDKIIAAYQDMTLEAYGVDRFFGSFAFVDTASFVAEGFPGIRQAAAEAKVPSTLPAPSVITAPRGGSSLTRHDVTLHYGHRVLRDFAADLAQGIQRPVGHEMDVYVGVHAVRGPLDESRFKVGIQTEQYLDSTGKEMWRKPRRRVRRALVSAYEAFLDLNPTNAPAYAFLPQDLRERMSFGPHIFPTEPVALAWSDKPPVFFGSLNDRRRAELLPLEEAGKVVLAPHGTFGRALTDVLKEQGGVLNIHFAEGEYAEYPRFLKAYLHGKPVFSEPMAAPLVAGKHYFPLGKAPTRKTTGTLFGHIAALAAEYSFQGYLETVAAKARQTQAAG